jgi:hypothetical protein
MAFTARKKVRSPSTSRVSRARREPVAGSVDGDAVFPASRLSPVVARFFPRFSSARRPSTATTRDADDLSPALS